MQKQTSKLMETFDEQHQRLNRQGWSCSYWGDNGEWYVFLGRSRDSDSIEECNWQEAIDRLDKLQASINWEEFSDDDVYAIESESHWAVGWVETMLINPECYQAIELAEKMLEDLESYPILNEDRLSVMESELIEEDWQAYGKDDCLRGLQERMDDETFDSLTDEQIDEAFDEARRNYSGDEYD